MKSKELKASSVKCIEGHTMGDALEKYVDIKIHHLISQFKGNKIIVRGKYERLTSVISANEKLGKRFNYKRPTVEIDQQNNVLYLNCFPGTDYVYHYYRIVSSYFAIHKIKTVQVVIEFPKETDSVTEILRSNILSMPQCEIVILGTVEKLHALTDYHPWEDKGDFVWSSSTICNKSVGLLGCKFSFWGNIAGDLVRVLASKGVRTVIYTGKLGGLQPQIQPNTTLSTGSESILNGKLIRWSNLISVPKHVDQLVTGVHYTLPSVLDETKSWFERIGKKYSFVDPEIGWMGYVAKCLNINFSYIHLVSDNVARAQEENLSNERSAAITKKRLLANAKIIEIIKFSIICSFGSIPRMIPINQILLIQIIILENNFKHKKHDKVRQNKTLGFVKINFLCHDLFFSDSKVDDKKKTKRSECPLRLEVAPNNVPRNKLAVVKIGYVYQGLFFSDAKVDSKKTTTFSGPQLPLEMAP